MKNLTKNNPKLKAMVEKFKNLHRSFCNALLHSAYRLTKEAAEIGRLLQAMQKEGRFKTKRRLEIWLELEVGHDIPRTTFYRYFNAAEWWAQAEIVHGQEALTDISSLKALKLLANPKVDFDPVDEGWAKKGDTYSQTIQGVHCEILHAESKTPTMKTNGEVHSIAGSLREACTIVAERAAVMARTEKALQEPTHADSPLPKKPKEAPATLKRPAAQDAVIENADNSDPNDANDEQQKTLEAAKGPTTKSRHTPQERTNGIPTQTTANGTPQRTTHFHHDCHNFEIDGNSLICLDQQGQKVILVAPKKQKIEDLLKDALEKEPVPTREYAQAKAKKTQAKKRRAAK